MSVVYFVYTNGLAKIGHAASQAQALSLGAKRIGDAPMKHAVLITNTGFSMVRHRGEQIRDLIARGWKVSAISLYQGDEADQARKLGAEPYNLSCAGADTGISENLAYLLQLTRLLYRLKPDVVHSFSFKCGVWGCFAARAARVRRIVCTITGNGYLVVGRSSLLKNIIILLMKAAFHSRTALIFQNEENLEFFVSRRIVKRSQCTYIPGCGVDVNAIKPNFRDRAVAKFVMVARMLWNKGVVPFCEAARIVKGSHPEATFLLVGGSKGDYGPQNDDFVPVEQLQDLARDSGVQWIGLVPPERAEQIMAEATAVVLLSSYGEGVPRVLIEAAALGAPIITTDVVGCRDVVEHGISGFICDGKTAMRHVSPPESQSVITNQAASAMLQLIECPKMVADMGREGRRVSERFDIGRVMAATMEVFEDATHSTDSHDQRGRSFSDRSVLYRGSPAGHGGRRDLTRLQEPKS